VLIQDLSLIVHLAPSPWTCLAAAGPGPDLWLFFLASHWTHLLTMVLLDLDFWAALDSWLDLATISDLPQSRTQVLRDGPCWTWGPTCSCLPEGVALRLLSPGMGAPWCGGPGKAVGPSVELVGNTEGGPVAKAPIAFSPWVLKARVEGAIPPFGASCVQGMTHIGRNPPWQQKRTRGSQHLRSLPCQSCFALGCRTKRWGRDQPGRMQRVSNLAGKGVTHGVPGGVCTPAYCCRPTPGCLSPAPSQWHPSSMLVLEMFPPSCAWLLTEKPTTAPCARAWAEAAPSPPAPGATGHALVHTTSTGSGWHLGSCLGVLRSGTVCRNPDAWTKRGLARCGSGKLLPAGIGPGARDAFAGVSPGAQFPAQLQGSVILQSDFGAEAMSLLRLVPRAPVACSSIIRDILARFSHFPVAPQPFVVPEKGLKAGDQLTFRLLLHMSWEFFLLYRQR